jgi:hypothetical protein
MPRKSAEELSLTVIDVQRQRLKPPAYLKKEERAIWEHVVGHSAPMHFKENEAPLLALYCTSIHLARFTPTRLVLPATTAATTSAGLRTRACLHRWLRGLGFRLPLATTRGRQNVTPTRLRLTHISRGRLGLPVRLIKGRVFVVPRSGGRVLICLQCETGTVYAMELQPPQVEAFLR